MCTIAVTRVGIANSRGGRENDLNIPGTCPNHNLRIW